LEFPTQTNIVKSKNHSANVLFFPTHTQLEHQVTHTHLAVYFAITFVARSTVLV